MFIVYMHLHQKIKWAAFQWHETHDGSFTAFYPSECCMMVPPIGWDCD